MAKRFVDVIHIATQSLPLAAQLAPDYRYLWAAVDDGEIIPGQPLFKKGHWNATFRDAVVLIDANSPWLNDPDKLSRLPSNRIIVDANCELDGVAGRTLDLKGAARVDFSDVTHLAEVINYNYYQPMNTYKIDFPEFVVDPDFKGNIHQEGEAYREFSGDFGADWVRVGAVRQVMWVGTYAGQDVMVENATTGSLEVKGEVLTFDGIDPNLQNRYEASGPEMRVGVPVAQKQQPRGMQFQLFVRGKGTLRLGDIHFRRTRQEYGATLVGGEKIIDPEGSQLEVQAYFDAGDLKPPLAVYFSGYQTAEKFEGFGMMRRMGTPFILIMDPRLEGGAFYLGSEQFETRVAQYIQGKLDALGFSSDELILSGISMGTYAALFYGARLNPHAIVVGKPLIHLGTIARNTRINRPADFGTSLDMLLIDEGGTSHRDIKNLDDRFWRTFRTGNFGKTTFAVAYMLDDDYDKGAFPALQKYLKDHYATVRIWSKGFVGRHNDDTASVVDFFTGRYNHLLETDFGR
ncbi:accessory Sec system protein Asp2 [Lacticaseibacillus pabuli]|uniref:Accessory Sec system protein Asp2 n=1 Tax=Lacticaseibacillus pabuli TaxID=3025672 RepID=A0ABY7WTE4_9LACO|nr:accessory Sec system protein Asp2 [Lacticaseibacillus sp. KACC 23028]WDF83074.1 accessory Sec system protein Asp2 [Lacticaseibacillus sp. KACC 23028]